MAPSTNDSTVAGLSVLLDRSPSPYHVASLVARRLDAAGFQRIERGVRWPAQNLSRGYLMPGDGAIVAFDLRCGSAVDGLTILAAHTDSPALRVRDRGIAWRKGYLALPTEIYGGPIVATWLDRDLGLAGRAVDASGAVHLFTLNLPVTIPNVAIHLNRTANEGLTYNAHDHLVAIAASEPDRNDANARDLIIELVAGAVDRDARDIDEIEALLYSREAAARSGVDGNLLCSGRIDNLAGCYTSLEAFLADGERPRMLVLYNHEEIGSQTGEGAQSDAIEALVRRLVSQAGGDGEDVAVAMERSLVVSNDAAHALHPSYSDRHDPDYAPVLGGGPVLKLNAMYRYATTAATGASFARACSKANVPLQRLSGRPDMKSGSTVGPMTWARTGMRTVDVGIPLLAMHSLRETAAEADVSSMIAALTRLLDEPPGGEG